jgi:hypothetical protein
MDSRAQQNKELREKFVKQQWFYKFFSECEYVFSELCERNNILTPRDKEKV